MRVKAKLKNGVVSVKMMAKHEMSTYNQAEKRTGDRNNANFITHISGTVNGKTVIDMSTSQFLSKNPIFKFKFRGDEFKKGDKLIMKWVDLKGHSKTKKAKIK
ncbi:Sulfur oxidation protein SoxZ [hydrothermal vent metagenome]|uniref:Sulfur oxidation protein SoxZ n=1 Tax=hydrothermal vent metagenome TaxID=652676 RepID=A0A1W1D3M3_9ZZZZ